MRDISLLEQKKLQWAKEKGEYGFASVGTNKHQLNFELNFFRRTIEIERFLLGNDYNSPNRTDLHQVNAYVQF